MAKALLLVAVGLVVAASAACSARVVGAADVYSDVRPIREADPNQEHAAAEAAASGLAAQTQPVAPDYVAQALPEVGP